MVNPIALVELVVRYWPGLWPPIQVGWVLFLTVLTFWLVIVLPVGLTRFIQSADRQKGLVRRLEPKKSKAGRTAKVPPESGLPQSNDSTWVELSTKRLLYETVRRGPGGRPVGIALSAGIALLAIATVWDLMIFRDWRIGGDRATATSVSGVDKTGKTATYRIVLLSAEYFWKYGSTAAVVNSEGMEVPLEQKLIGNGVANLVNRSSDLIAVGTASCVGGTDEEEYRAFDRARNLAAWLRQVPLSDGVERIYQLNLGQYNEPCGYGPREREQRMVLVIGVTEKQQGVDVRESFRDALEKAARGPLRRLDLTAYTNWPADRFTLDLVF